MAFGIAELQAASPGLLAGITTTLEIVAIAVAGGMVIGDVQERSLVWPHPEETWPVVRTLVGE